MRTRALWVTSLAWGLATAADARAQSAAPGDAPMSTTSSVSAAPAAPPTVSERAKAAAARGPTMSERAVADHQAALVQFQVRISDLEDRVDQAETRTSVLASSVLSGTVVRTRATIAHVNRLGGGFTIDRATYMLDGETILDRANDDGRLDEDTPIPLFSGPIQSGDHELRVVLRVRGQAYGPFTYLEGYKFNVTSRYVFRVVEGRLNELQIVAKQKDDITVEPQDRLTIGYDVEVVDPTRKPAPTDR